MKIKIVITVESNLYAWTTNASKELELGADHHLELEGAYIPAYRVNGGAGPAKITFEDARVVIEGEGKAGGSSLADNPLSGAASGAAQVIVADPALRTLVTLFVEGDPQVWG